MRGMSRMTMKAIVFSRTLAEGTGCIGSKKRLSCGRFGDQRIHGRKLSIHEQNLLCQMRISAL